MQIVMPMEYAADVSPAYAGMAAREHAISALVTTPMGIAAYLAQQQNVMAAPQSASVVPPMGMMTANSVAAQIDQQRNMMAASQLASVALPMGMVPANPVAA
jgi:hypothetical protein